MNKPESNGFGCLVAWLIAVISEDQTRESVNKFVCAGSLIIVS